MLRYTLVLPESDPTFSAQALKDAIADLGVILMLVLGATPKAKQTVDIADALCEGSGTGGFRKRRVVWVRDPSAPSIQKILKPILGEPFPFVAVLNFSDVLKKALGPKDPIDEIELEIAFLEGYQP